MRARACRSSLSTLADQVGAGCAVLEPLLRRIEAHVFAAERLHGDDTTVPVLAKGKTDHRTLLGLRARRSAVRRQRAAGGDVLLLARSRRRASSRRIWPAGPGCCRPTPMAGYNKLYAADRKPGPILEAACWAHARRPFFALADIEASGAPQGRGQGAGADLAAGAGGRAAHRCAVRDRASINGKSAEERRAVRQELSAPLVADLEAWMREERAKLSRGSDLAKAMDYMLKRWPAFTRFLDDGRVCLSNNAAERACAVLPLDGSRGCSPAPIAAASAPPPCTA